MRLAFTVGVYRWRAGDVDRWAALLPGEHEVVVEGASEPKARERLVDELRKVLRQVPPREQELVQLPLGTELVRLPVELKLDDGRVHGLAPFIVEPRWTGPARQRLLAYHPRRRAEWLLAEDLADLAQLAPGFFRHHWKRLDAAEVSGLLSNGKDRLVAIGFSAEPRSLLDDLPSRRVDPRARAAAARPGGVLKAVGVDETQRAASGEDRAGQPRSPYRERLAHLLGGPRPRSVAVVGPPGAGKTSLIRRWIADRLVADGYPLHRNLDRVAHVWRLSGKRLIAGMSYLGQWEERCLGLLQDVKANAAILWIEDLHLFGRLGQSRQSERSFADFFRGPVRRGSLSIVAELSPEQLARLERDAPGLAEALAPVAVAAASPEETARLLLHEVRAIELELPVALHPYVPRTALELAPALFPWRARPGVAIEVVRRVAEHGAQAKQAELGPADVLEHLARATGLPPRLISLDEPLDPAEVEAAFARRVIGQPAATRAAAADVILRVRAGLADPHRPIGVLLFTGPTGTGKTELATAIAEYLYGGGDRLLRIDMGELSGPDAVARLIGDRWNPEGLLTSRVRAQPFCVVLLDEIEKAHPQALHLLLQLFDEGRLTDAAGEVASFASAVVIMTSNLGSRSAAPIGFGETRDRILADVARAVREFFPVELFNRIDRVVPFEPLTPEVAAAVVAKELAKLLARRGLRERNTFVYAGAAVRRRAVADAFDPRYGARTVKRWLEERVGGALTDLLAAAPPARLRIVRLTEDAGQLVASLEPMLEAPQRPGPYALEGLLDTAAGALDRPLARAAAALERVRRSDVLAAARRAATGALRFYVDDLEQRVAALGALFAAAGDAGDRARDDRGGAPDGPGAAGDPGDDAAAGADDAGAADDGAGAADDDAELDDPVYEEVGQLRRQQRAARARLVRPHQAPRRPPAARDALLAGIAEALLLERALPELLDPDAHAVTAIVSRAGGTAGSAGLAIAALALAQPHGVDELACIDGTGAVRELPCDAPALAALWQRGGALPAPEGRARARPGDPARAGDPAVAHDLALVVRGLFARAALAGEHGTWMISAEAMEPDVVRVEVRPGAAAAPAEALRAHAAARARLERVLEEGGPLPPNPDAVLPVIRALSYRVPLRPREPYAVELEDFATGWVDRGRVAAPAEAFRRARQLAWSRLAAAAAPAPGDRGRGPADGGAP